MHATLRGCLATAGTLALMLSLSVVARAQDDDGTAPADEQPADGEDAVTGPPPQRSGTIRLPPHMRSAGEDSLTTGDVDGPAGEDVDDDRTELLVFDLTYEQGISFDDTYLERFEAAFQEAIDASPDFRALTTTERSRRLSRASQLIAGPPDDDDAERLAEAIGVDYYFVPRVEIASRRNYRIRMLIGRTGEGEAGRQVFADETNRGVNNVEAAIRNMSEQALAADPGSAP